MGMFIKKLRKSIEKYGDNEIVLAKEETTDTPRRNSLKRDKPSERTEMATLEGWHVTF